MHYIAPYVKATFGPVYVESEVIYLTGKAVELDAPVVGATDVDVSGWSAYLYAKANLGPAYVGARVGWASGDDGSDPSKSKAGVGGGIDWNPALILMNYDLNVWKYGTGASTANSGKANMLLYNIFGGFDPTPKINVQAALTTASADKVGAGVVSKKMGTEFDVTATYKLYDNLSYMVGAGYLWTGDAFKGTNSAKVIGNDYLLMNKLTLSF